MRSPKASRNAATVMPMLSVICIRPAIVFFSQPRGDEIVVEPDLVSVLTRLPSVLSAGRVLGGEFADHPRTVSVRGVVGELEPV
jgi:hypothetical protein